jgi:hypothetical protein
MHLIKYNSRQALKPYMSRHRGAILREFFRIKQYKASTLNKAGCCITFTAVIKTAKF